MLFRAIVYNDRTPSGSNDEAMSFYLRKKTAGRTVFAKLHFYRRTSGIIFAFVAEADFQSKHSTPIATSTSSSQENEEPVHLCKVKLPSDRMALR